MTKLCFRPVELRIEVAQMADGHFDFETCPTGNTFDRVFSDESMIDMAKGKGQTAWHPYRAMWDQIGSFYRDMGFEDLSDAELAQIVASAKKRGFTTPTGVEISATKMQKIKAKWLSNGWFRYEHKRQSRRNIVRKNGLLAVAIVGACMGIQLPTE